MGSDRRSVSTDALETLGTIIDSSQKRDAIHLAVEPVIAGEFLNRGQSINVIHGVAYAAKQGKGLFIVDPFLPEKWEDVCVEKGDRFWAVMRPREVKSLRHEWEHPDVPNNDKSSTNTNPDSGYYSKEESEAWLRRFFARTDCPSYDIVMELLDKNRLESEDDDYESGGVYDEDKFIFIGMDAHGKIPNEFWGHAENVLGKKLPYRHEYFSCSC